MSTKGTHINTNSAGHSRTEPGTSRCRPRAGDPTQDRPEAGRPTSAQRDPVGEGTDQPHSEQQDPGIPTRPSRPSMQKVCHPTQPQRVAPTGMKPPSFKPPMSIKAMCTHLNSAGRSRAGQETDRCRPTAGATSQSRPGVQPSSPTSAPRNPVQETPRGTTSRNLQPVHLDQEVIRMRGVKRKNNKPHKRTHNITEAIETDTHTQTLTSIIERETNECTDRGNPCKVTGSKLTNTRQDENESKEHTEVTQPQPSKTQEAEKQPIQTRLYMQKHKGEPMLSYKLTPEKTNKPGKKRKGLGNKSKARILKGAQRHDDKQTSIKSYLIN